jgi:hypothetical protein
MTLIIAILLLLLVVYHNRTRSFYLINSGPFRVPNAPFAVTNPPNFVNVKEPIGELTSFMLKNNVQVE